MLIASTPLASTPMCRLVGSPVIAKLPPSPRLTTPSVGDAHEPDAHPLLVLDVLERAHHRRQRAFHVVGATAEQLVAVHSRLVLLLAPGDHVEMAVEDHARQVLARRSDLGHQHGQPVVIVMQDFDVAGFKPTLDKSCCRDEFLGARRVVGDQPLCKDPLVDHPERLRAFGYCEEALEAVLVALCHAPAL
jgi:hypothetical protein